MAVASADSGITCYLGVRHRAVVGGTGKPLRPLSSKTYSYATDAAGKLLLKLTNFPVARELFRRANAGFADAAPVRLQKPSEEDLPKIIDRSFLKVACALKSFAFALAENSANEVPVASQTGNSGGYFDTRVIVPSFQKAHTEARPDLKYILDSEEFLFRFTDNGQKYRGMLQSNVDHFVKNGGPALAKAHKAPFSRFVNLPGKSKYKGIMQARSSASIFPRPYFRMSGCN